MDSHELDNSNDNWENKKHNLRHACMKIKVNTGLWSFMHESHYIKVKKLFQLAWIYLIV